MNILGYFVLCLDKILFEYAIELFTWSSYLSYLRSDVHVIGHFSTLLFYCYPQDFIDILLHIFVRYV
jgi:hypothetical protein